MHFVQPLSSCRDLATAAVLCIQPPSPQPLTEYAIVTLDAELTAGLSRETLQDDDLRPLGLQLHRVAGEPCSGASRLDDNARLDIRPDINGAALQYSSTFCPPLARLLASHLQANINQMLSSLQKEANSPAKLVADLVSLCRASAIAIKACARQERLLLEHVDRDWQRNSAPFRPSFRPPLVQPAAHSSETHMYCLGDAIASGLEAVCECLRLLTAAQLLCFTTHTAKPVEALLDLLVEDAKEFALWRDLSVEPVVAHTCEPHVPPKGFHSLQGLLLARASLRDTYNALFLRCSALYKDALKLDPHGSSLSSMSAQATFSEDDLLFNNGKRGMGQPGIQNTLFVVLQSFHPTPHSPAFYCAHS